MKKVINNIHKNYPKSSNTTWWRLPEEVKDIEERTTSLEGRDLSDFKNESANKFIRSLDLAELGQQIKFDFKKGSIGEKVSFTKVSGTDPNTNKDIIIPGELEITRGNSGGIYNIAVEPNYNSSNNSPENTFWNTQYVDADNTSWSPLWDIQSRTYTDWRNAVDGVDDYVPPQYAGIYSVIKWDNGTDNPRYWLIKFTHWGVGGNNDYSFAYERYEIFSEVYFERPDNQLNVIDIISEGVHLKRNSNGGLFNAVVEDYSNNGSSPINTKWNSSFIDSRPGYSGWDDLSNLESRRYTSFIDALDANVGNNIPGTDLVMWDMTTDLYYKINFDSWTQGGGPNTGGFAYYRTVIPQSCGIKFADGTVLNTASVSSSAASYDMAYTKGTLDVNVESDFIQLADTIVVPPSNGITAYTLSTFGTLVVGDCFEVFGIGGSGSGAMATINIIGPSSYNFTITDPGTNYEIGDIVDFTCGTATISTNVTGIDNASATTYNKYKLKGIVNFPNVNSLSSVYLIGVISGSDKLVMTGDQTTMKATVNIYNELYSKFGVNSYIRNSDTGNFATTTFGTIVLDNTLASPDDYFISIIANSSIAKWESVAYLDIEFIAPAANNLTFSN